MGVKSRPLLCCGAAPSYFHCREAVPAAAAPGQRHRLPLSRRRQDATAGRYHRHLVLHRYNSSSNDNGSDTAGDGREHLVDTVSPWFLYL